MAGCLAMGPFAAGHATGCEGVIPVEHPTDRWPGQHAWQSLAKAGYHVGDIRIRVIDVYDLSKPEQNTWYARTGDFLHINTKKPVVRHQLLFKPGDRVDPRLIYESTRRLRHRVYFREADIVPVACHGHVVDAEVVVKDAWTLKFEVNFGRIGGQNRFGLRLLDANFLGTGKYLAFARKKDPERTTSELAYHDDQLFGSNWTMNIHEADLSDGYRHQISIGRPFFETTTPWSVSFDFEQLKQNLNFYNRTDLAWRVPDTQETASVGWMHLIRWDGDSGWRSGLRLESEKYTYGTLESVDPALRPPPVLDGRTFNGVVWRSQYYQDRYASFSNILHTRRTEDFNLGWNVTTDLGWFPTSLGGTASAWKAGVDASFGARPFADTLLLSNASVSSRRQGGVWRNYRGDLAATLYDQHYGSQTLVAHFAAAWQLRPDPENQLYLGGLEGLRGYPNYFIAADRRWTATLADRIDTPTDIFHTVQLGYVAYVDFGQARALDNGEWTRVFSNVGGGFRFGNLRSSFGRTLYLTVAFPLTKTPQTGNYQIVVGDVIPF
jgi:hypothetical protein